MWFAGMAMMIFGCNTQVIGGGSGGSGGGNDTTTGSGNNTTTGVYSATSSGDFSTTGSVIMSSGSGFEDAGPPPVDDGPAIAMLYSELPTVVDPTGSVVASGGPAIDPNSLFLFVSNGAQSCADPYAYSGGCATPRYQISILLPQTLQAVGTYPLDNLATMSVTEPGGGNTCSGGGGSYWDGTITITAINATHVSFTLAGTGKLFFSGTGNADGAYTAKRCF
jgi:hypothetical protein